MAMPGGMQRPRSGRGVIRRCVLILSLSAFSSHAKIPAPFWASQIDSALHNRDLLFRAVLHGNDSFPVIELDRERKAECLERLAALPDSGSVWYAASIGLLRSDVAGVSTSSFERSLDIAANHPGDLWVLSAEFARNSQTQWANRCLLRLEQLLLESGAVSAPAISQQLMYYGVSREKHHDFDNAGRYFAWAQRFDPDQPWSLLHRARLLLPSHPIAASLCLREIMHLFGHSWALQLSLADHAYDWLRLVIMAWVFVVFTGLSLRHLPQAVHPLADRLPETIPPSIRTGLVIAMVAATVAFGALPFLWLLAFLILPFLEKRERPLVILALVFLTAAPLDSRIEECFRQARHPAGSVSLYLRACDEGYSAEIRRCAIDKISSNTGDALAYLALSQSLLKSGDITGARLAATSAQSLRADDPEALSCAGRAAYMAGDYATAASYYRKIIEIHPGFFPALYNLSRCSVSEADTAVNLDFIGSLPAGDRKAAREFIARNDACFGDRWPLSRQLMNGHCPEVYFRTPYFRAYGGTWEGATRLWAGSFFGLAPLPCLFIFLILAAVVIFRQALRGSRPAKRPIGRCCLCNRPVCDACRRGTLCHACFHAMSAEVPDASKGLTERIKGFHERRRTMVASVLDIGLPGSGMLFASTDRWPVTVLVGTITAFIYGSCMFAAKVNFNYPMWVLYGEPEKLLYWVPGYNLLFVGRMVIAAVRKRGT